MKHRPCNHPDPGSFLLGIWVEPRALGIIGKCSITEPNLLQLWVTVPSAYLFLFLSFSFFGFSRQGLENPGYSGTHLVDQAGLELVDPPASASRESWD